MASMSDVIFLLLIFFMVLSTLVVPNAIRVNLPASAATAPSEAPLARITLSQDGLVYFQSPAIEVVAISWEDLPNYLAKAKEESAETYVALYADEELQYSEIVRVINIVAEFDLPLVLATKALHTSVS